jgi:hypothetical protein
MAMAGGVGDGPMYLIGSSPLTWLAFRNVEVTLGVRCALRQADDVTDTS